jgi:hypothetical protein
MLTVGVRSWAAVFTATGTRIVTEGRGITQRTVATAPTVAHSIPIAVLWTYCGVGLLSQRAHSHALLIHTHLKITNNKVITIYLTF